MANVKKQNSSQPLWKRIRKALLIYLSYGCAFSFLCIFIGMVTSVPSFLYTAVLWLPIMIQTFPYESKSVWIYIFLILFLFMEVQIIVKE